MTDLAIYDMDRTVTRRATYTPFLIHCALHRAPWRLLLLPLVVGSMLAYLAKLIDRGKLKEINHRLLLGDLRHPGELKPLIDSFAEATLAVAITTRRPSALSRAMAVRAPGRMLLANVAAAKLAISGFNSAAWRTLPSSRR